MREENGPGERKEQCLITTPAQSQEADSDKIFPLDFGLKKYIDFRLNDMRD